MVKIRTIQLTRAEGAVADLATVTVTSWDAATATLRAWARTAPRPGDGCHKCDFIVAWENGQTHKGRYDLECLEVKTPNFAHFFRRYIAGMAGMLPPPHWSEAQYKTVLNRNPDLTRWAKDAYLDLDVGRILVA